MTSTSAWALQAVAAKPWRVTGEVTDAVSGEALAGATVMAWSPGSGGAQATTDAQGCFQMEGPGDGSFRLFVMANGHLRSEYGSDSPGIFGKPVQLRSGTTLDHISIKAVRPSEIQGTLEWPNRTGPVSECAVEALRPTLFRGEVRNLTASFAQSGPDGRFHLTGLEPGDYLVRIKCRTQLKRSSDTEAKSGAIQALPEWIVAYYPQGSRADSGRMVHLAANEQASLGAIEMRPPSDVVTVRGILRGSDGSFPTGVQATLYAPDDSIPAISAGYPCTIDPTHMFTCRGVPAGEYRLLASWVRPATNTVDAFYHCFPLMAKEATEPVRIEFDPNATVQVKATQQKVEGLAGPGEEPGPIRVQLGGTQVAFESTMGTWKAGAAILIGNEPGQISLPPGHYRAVVQGLAPGDYLYAVRGSGVTDERAALVNVEPAASGASLEFIIRSDGGELQGTLTTESGETIPGMQVALMPSNEAYAMNMARFTATDATGRFQFDSIPPGSYEVRVSTHIDPLSLKGPESQTVGKVRIRSSEKLTKTLTMSR